MIFVWEYLSRMDEIRSDQIAAEAFRRAVKAAGSQSALSRKIGIGQAAISKRLAKGQHCPAECVLKVEASTGVSRFDLRPDLYQRDSLATDRGREPELFVGADA